MGTWAVTVADVNDLTGVTVDDNTVSIAGGIVELYINRTDAASGSMTPRDYTWVRRMVCYQAAWLPGQLGYFERQQASEIIQDGVATRAYGSGQGGEWREWAATLAPLAARTMKNLSWKTTRRTGGGVVRIPNAGVSGDPFFLDADLGTW